MNPVRVLVVDDDDFMLELVSEQLEQIEGVEVVPVSDGWSALAFVDDEVARPDLMVFDLGLSGLHGTEMMRLLADRGYRGAVLVMSGSPRHMLDAAADIARGYGLHLLDAVSKPVDPAQLRAAVEQVQRQS
ncbi:MAG: response regulator [Actinomycetota bacterium]